MLTVILPRHSSKHALLGTSIFSVVKLEIVLLLLLLLLLYFGLEIFSEINKF